MSESRRTGELQASALANQVADHLERIVKELRSQKAYVSRTYMEELPDNPMAIRYTIDLIRADRSSIHLEETGKKGDREKHHADG